MTAPAKLYRPAHGGEDTLRIITGDCRESLRTLDAESVQCCVLSRQRVQPTMHCALIAFERPQFNEERLHTRDILCGNRFRSMLGYSRPVRSGLGSNVFNGQDQLSLALFDLQKREAQFDKSDRRVFRNVHPVTRRAIRRCGRIRAHCGREPLCEGIQRLRCGEGEGKAQNIPGRLTPPLHLFLAFQTALPVDESCEVGALCDRESHFQYCHAGHI